MGGSESDYSVCPRPFLRPAQDLDKDETGTGQGWDREGTGWDGTGTGQGRDETGRDGELDNNEAQIFNNARVEEWSGAKSELCLLLQILLL